MCKPKHTVSENRSILIVDDDELMRELMGVMISQDGYRVVTAANASEALRLAGSIPIDLLITDLQMPGMTGTDLIRTLIGRGLIERSILVTGDVSAIDQVDERGGSIPFLEKPFNFGELREKVRLLLQD